MNRFLSFFEIPSIDFNRATKFYEEVFGVKFSIYNCDTEKMAFFPEEDGICRGAISWAADFKPSENGVLISLNCAGIDETLEKIEKNGGKMHTPKTKIEADNRQYFAIFIDCEGNRIGLYSEK